MWFTFTTWYFWITTITWFIYSNFTFSTALLININQYLIHLGYSYITLIPVCWIHFLSLWRKQKERLSFIHFNSFHSLCIYYHRLIVIIYIYIYLYLYIYIHLLNLKQQQQNFTHTHFSFFLPFHISFIL